MEESEKLFVLNNGVKMPAIGFGTYQLKGEEAFQPTIDAIKTGYRLVDSATIYRNEKEVGRAIKESIKRSDIFITSKLFTKDQGYESTLKAVEKSMELLNVDYIDLYLIHWPGTSVNEFFNKGFESK